MKRKIKEEVFCLREGQEQEDRLRKSIQIAKRLFRLPEFKNARNIMLYSSIKCEVETATIIELALQTKFVTLPVTKGHNIFASEISTNTLLQSGKFNILEPVKPKEFPPDDIDLIVIPGIAFDAKGNRLGYGHGYYDKFLAKTKAFKVALAYDLQLVPSIPNESHDIPVDVIVTETKTIRCTQ